MLDQMVREWEIPEVEMKKELLTLEEKHNQDPYKRPPLLRNLDPSAWVKYVSARPYIAKHFAASSRRLKSIL